MSQTEPRRPKRWILVVDDEANVRAVWIEALELEGYKAVGCGDGYEAFDIVRDIVPDLIILDLRMRRSSGVDFLANVRREPRLRSIPVLIVSGFLNEEPLNDADLNIVGKMEKPVSLDTLIQKVRAVLDSSAPPRFGR